MTASPRPLFLGIDTGGTYTDAVLWSEEPWCCGAKAKALTTRHDLAEGISGAVDAVLDKARVDPAAIKLVSMSTTLATNALVEGQGGRVALVMIGFSEADLARDGLKAALGSDPLVFCPGGHDVHGNAATLDLAALEAALPELAKSVSGFAVCAYFATRNPAHEILARDLIREKTGLPVTASHELSSKLGGPRRALTTLLNARLISMIDRLVAATEGFLAARGDKGAADGGARRRRAGVGRLRPPAADRDHPVRPRRQPRRRPPHDRARQCRRFRHRRHHHRRRGARPRPAAARPGGRHRRRLPHHGRGGRHAHLRPRRRFRGCAEGRRARAEDRARPAPPGAAGAGRHGPWRSGDIGAGAPAARAQSRPHGRPFRRAHRRAGQARRRADAAGGQALRGDHERRRSRSTGC